jgi:guanylate kinase
MIEEKKFLEWARYTDNYYGTPRTPVESRLEQGQNVLLEIEVIGARKIKENFPDSLTIFILPPSLEELERRLLERGTETQEVIARRLEKAQQEILASAEFDYSICNDDLEITIEDLERIIFS